MYLSKYLICFLINITIVSSHHLEFVYCAYENNAPKITPIGPPKDLNPRYEIPLEINATEAVGKKYVLTKEAPFLFFKFFNYI